MPMEVRKDTGYGCVEEQQILDSIKEGEIKYISHTSSLVLRRGGKAERTKVTYFVPYSSEGEKDNGAEALNERIRELKEMGQELGRQQNLKVLAGAADEIRCRKILEACNRNSGLRIYCRFPDPEALKRKESTRPEATALTIKSDGVSYADLLKKLRKEVDVGALDIKIDKIVKTANNSVRITVEGEEATKARKLRAKIESRINDVNVVERDNASTIFLLGVDAATSEAEVIDAVSTSIGASSAKVKVASLRFGDRGQGTAVVNLPKDYARKLARLNKIKVGWVKCTVKERVGVSVLQVFGARASLQGMQGTDQQGG